MTLLLFLTGLTTTASTAPSPPVATTRFTVSGSQVWGKFPSTTVVSTYAPITFPTE